MPSTQHKRVSLLFSDRPSSGRELLLIAQIPYKTATYFALKTQPAVRFAFRLMWRRNKNKHLADSNGTVLHYYIFVIYG